MAASEKLLGDCHELLAVYLKHKLSGAIEDADKVAETTEDGIFIPRQMTAAEMAVVVALCKNSNITAAKSKTSALGELEAILKKNKAPSAEDMSAAIESVEFKGVLN